MLQPYYSRRKSKRRGRSLVATGPLSAARIAHSLIPVLERKLRIIRIVPLAKSLIMTLLCGLTFPTSVHAQGSWKPSDSSGNVLPYFDPTYTISGTCSQSGSPTQVEPGNSRLKDEFGLRHLRVRGNAKVHMYIMFGTLALFAEQLLKPPTG